MLPGRLTSWKGHMLLIDALAELKRRNRDNIKIRCLMDGQDQGRSAYRAAILAHAALRGVDGQVQIVDDCNDSPAAVHGDGRGRLRLDPARGSSAAWSPPRLSPWDGRWWRPITGPRRRSSNRASPDGCSRRAMRRLLADALNTALALDQDGRIRLADAAITRARALFDKADMCAKTLAVYDELVPVPVGGDHVLMTSRAWSPPPVAWGRSFRCWARLAALRIHHRGDHITLLTAAETVDFAVASRLADVVWCDTNAGGAWNFPWDVPPHSGDMRRTLRENPISPRSTISTAASRENVCSA